MPIPRKVTNEFFTEESDIEYNLTFAGENIVREENTSTRHRVSDLIHIMNMIYEAYGQGNNQTSSNSTENNSNQNSSEETTNRQQENSNNRNHRNGLFNFGDLDSDALDYLLMRQRMRYQRNNDTQQTQAEEI